MIISKLIKAVIFPRNKMISKVILIVYLKIQKFKVLIKHHQHHQLIIDMIFIFIIYNLFKILNFE